MPKAKLKLIDAPRLFVTAENADHLAENLHSAYLQDMADKVIRDANWLVRTDPLTESDLDSYLARTRCKNSHFDCLTAAWILTRKAKYRAAAMKHVASLLKWNHISCEARANTPANVDMPFCLSYGEQSASLGLMYDHFRPDMTADEQQVFFDVVDRFHLKQAIACVANPMWWANKSWSNWNGVCAGGMGILGLALYTDRKDAGPLIPFVEGSLGEYFKSYIENGGGCHEGTGYWNYGMNYAMRYVLAWENATQRKHPALKIKELGITLNFPVDFTGISFGDNDGWHPAFFFFRLAERMNMPHAAMRAAAFLARPTHESKHRRKQTRPFVAGGDLLYAAPYMPTDRELDRYRKQHQRKPAPVARVYKGLDWAALADDEAFPKLRMSIRGGSAKVAGHGMIDLLGFHCRVNGELFITDQHDTGYLTTTFGKRGSEIYPRSAAAKSTLFVEGLGPAADATCPRTEVVAGPGLSGIRIDATGIYLPRLPARFTGRLFLFVDNQYWLIVDHVVGRTRVNDLGIESRFHTYCTYKVGKDSVALTSGKEKMQMTFAALQPGVLQQSRGMPPLPTGEPTTIFRWMGAERTPDNLHVTALNPGPRKLGLQLSKQKGNVYQIEVTNPAGRNRRIKVSSQLRLR